MNKKIIASLATVALVAMPLVSFAAMAAPNAVTTLTLDNLIAIVFSIIWPIFIAFAVIMFIMAAVKFFSAQGDPDKAGEARSFVLYGVLGMVVAILAFSIPYLVKNILNAGVPGGAGF